MNRSGLHLRQINMVLSLLLIVSCLLNPLFSVYARAEISVKEERELSERLLRQVLPQVTLVRDPEVTDYVARVGRNIINVMGPRYFQYRFFVIQDEALNAFAMPGGLVFVHSGLIQAIDSENELACVLAHEFAHVRARHVIKRMENMRYVSIGTTIMALAGLFLGKSQAASAIFTGSMALGQSIALKYSRADEQEADRRALEWICKAGYNPEGLVTTLKKMMRNQWFGTTSIPQYLSTHPAPDQRITYIEDYLKSHPCPERRREDSFLLKKIKLKLKIISSEPQKLIREYQKEAELHPEDPFVWYALALSFAKARRFNKAFDAFEKITLLQGDQRVFALDYAAVCYQAGKYREAVRRLRDFLVFNPGSDSAVFLLARALSDSGRAAESLKYFKRIESRWEDDPEFLFCYGRALSFAGRPGAAHYYLYRYYSLVGDARTAAYHKKQALKALPDGSPLKKRLEKADAEEKSEKQGDDKAAELAGR